MLLVLGFDSWGEKNMKSIINLFILVGSALMMLTGCNADEECASDCYGECVVLEKIGEKSAEGLQLILKDLKRLHDGMQS